MSAQDDLRASVQLARQALEQEQLHPIWRARLAVVEQIIRWAFKTEATAEYWSEVLDAAEQQVDRGKR